jgi:predicted GNAT family acetyltransferase
VVPNNEHTMSERPAITITHLANQRRFETHVDGLRCELDYILHDQVMAMTHTGVPRALEGRGIAAQLVEAGLKWAQAEGLKVRPVCSYVLVYMKRHAEWQHLLA